MSNPQQNHRPPLLDTKAAARMLGVSPRTLSNWRHRGGGPKFKRIGRLARYALEDVEDFLHAQTRRNTW